MRISLQINQSWPAYTNSWAEPVYDILENEALGTYKVYLASRSKNFKLVAIEVVINIVNSLGGYISGTEILSTTVQAVDAAGNAVPGIQPNGSNLTKLDKNYATFTPYSLPAEPLDCPEGFQVSHLMLRTPRYVSAAPPGAPYSFQGVITFVLE